MNYDNYMTKAEFAEVGYIMQALSDLDLRLEEVGVEVLLNDKNGESLGVITKREGELVWTPEDSRDA